MDTTKKRNNILTLAALAAAVILGLFAPGFTEKLSFIGTIYVNLLKFMIFPIVFTSIATVIDRASERKSSTLRRTVPLFIAMFILSFLLTAAVVLLAAPGADYSYDATEWSGNVADISVTDVLVNLFPSNIISMIENNSLFFVIIMAFLIGRTAGKVENGREVIRFLDGLKNISYTILGYIMHLTPLAIVSLLGGAIAKYGSSIFAAGGKYILFGYICSLLVMALVMILPVWILAGVDPVTYVKKIYRVWIMTVTTCSSAATLPTTMRTCNEELGVPSEITSITVPLGCTINMCGGAVSFALLGIFCSQMYGMEISAGKFLLMIFYALVINMAAPGIPNGGIVMGATYLSILGIPLTFIGFYSSIYKLLDIPYTTLNVTGDITADVILGRQSREKRIS